MNVCFDAQILRGNNYSMGQVSVFPGNYNVMVTCRQPWVSTIKMVAVKKNLSFVKHQSNK